MSSSSSSNTASGSSAPAMAHSKGKQTAAAPAKKQPYPMYLGGLSASIAAVATHPLDVSKVRMQTSKNHSFFGVLVESVKADVYDALKEKFSDGTGPIAPWKLAIAASVAGGAGGLAGNPADIVLVRMIGDVNRPPEKRLNYKNAIDGVAQIVKKEGSTALFRGLGPNISRAILMNASQLATYDSFKDILIKTGYFREGLLLHFTSGLMAGTVATTICSPFDVIKSRIMNSSKNEGALQVISKSFQREGVSWCFRGWTPAWIRLAPNSLIIFLVLEQLRGVVDRSRARQA